MIPHGQRTRTADRPADTATTHVTASVLPNHSGGINTRKRFQNHSSRRSSRRRRGRLRCRLSWPRSPPPRPTSPSWVLYVVHWRDSFAGSVQPWTGLQDDPTVCAPPHAPDHRQHLPWLHSDSATDATLTLSPVLQAALDALRVGAVAACRLHDASAAAGLRHIAFAGFSMLPELLQQQGSTTAEQGGRSSRTTAANEGKSGSIAAAEPAAVGDGSEPATAAAANPGSRASLQWRADILAWLHGVEAQAASCHDQAAAAYAAALPALHADAQMLRYVRERLAECHAATGHSGVLQRLAAGAEQVTRLIVFPTYSSGSSSSGSSSSSSSAWLDHSPCWRHRLCITSLVLPKTYTLVTHVFLAAAAGGAHAR